MGIIDEILDKVTIEDVLSILPDLKQQGSNYVGLCPSGHSSDSKTSFQVNINQPNFQCWNCGVSGNYIHLLELVRSGVSSSGNGWTDTFAEATKEFASILGIQNEQKQGSGNYSVKVFDIVSQVINEYHKQMPEAFKKGLSLKYGWTIDFINQEKIGYGEVCPSRKFLEFYSEEELLSTGLFNKSKNGGLFHIYQHRVVFPYLISGRVKYSAGRSTRKTTWKSDGKAPKYFKQYVYSDKRPFISKSIVNDIISCKKDSNEIIIAEGLPDYLSMKMHGYNSVSAVTVQFRNKDAESISNYCKKFNTVFICNDNEDSNAGAKGAGRIAESLIKNGIDPRIIILPKDDSREKIDLNDFMKEFGKEQFEKVKSNSISYVEYRISQIDPDIDKTKLLKELKPILNMLSTLDKNLIDIYIGDKIAKHFKLTGMNDLIRGLKRETLEGTKAAQLEITNNDEAFKDHNSNFKSIGSGQDFKDGNMYYTVTKPATITDKKGVHKAVNKIYVIGSDRTIHDVQDGQVIDQSFILNKKLHDGFKSDGWDFLGEGNTIQSFINNESKVNPADIYKRILSRFNKHVYFKNDGIPKHISLVIMASYQLMLFHSVGYIHFWAEKRSGKTTALEIINELGFNARMSSSISDAAIFRLIEMHRLLLLIDEAENLNPTAKQRENGMVNERLELYKSGYKRNGSATRCEGQTNTPMDFSNYCIKIFASIKNLDSTLEDRTIVHEFKRADTNENIKEWIPDVTKEEFKTLKNDLYTFGLTYANEVHEIYTGLSQYDEILARHKITHRSREIWGAYLSIALLIDRYDPSLNLFESVLKIASNSIETKEAFNAEGKNLDVLERLYLWTQKIKRENLYSDNEEDIFLRKEITNKFIGEDLKSDDDEDDFSYMTYRYLKQVLRRFHVIDKDSELRQCTIRSDSGTGILLNRDKLLNALKTYKKDLCDEVLNDLERIPNLEELKVD